MIQDFGDLLKDFKQMAQELTETPSEPEPEPKPNPEPAEGQVPAGDFVPVLDNVFQSEPEQVTASQEKSINEVAREVLAGKWGRGQIRKKRLQDAGFDVAAVSEEITRILNQ
jgi:hypothetical protein